MRYTTARKIQLRHVPGLYMVERSGLSESVAGLAESVVALDAELSAESALLVGRTGLVAEWTELVEPTDLA